PAQESGEAPRPDHAEILVDAGVVANRVLAAITTITPRVESGTSYGAHVAVGARRAVSEHQDVGVAVEADHIQGLSLVGARILDYRYRFTGPLALSLFGGAARYANATPAYGFYLGGGLQWRNIMAHWDLGIDYRYAAKLDRLRVLPGEPQGGYRPDAYYEVSMGTLYVSRKFLAYAAPQPRRHSMRPQVLCRGTAGTRLPRPVLVPASARAAAND